MSNRRKATSTAEVAVVEVTSTHPATFTDLGFPGVVIEFNQSPHYRFAQDSATWRRIAEQIVEACNAVDVEFAAIDGLRTERLLGN
jgi:hypothetical protein